MTSKNKPRIALFDLLRRRDTSLETFLSDRGITTYSSLEIHCESLGVAVPTKEKFDEVRGNKTISSPGEGVLVIEPVALPGEIDPEFPVEERTQKKPRRKNALRHLETPTDDEQE